MNTPYTYLTQIRTERPRVFRAAIPGQIDCVLARQGTFATGDACLAATSCGYLWGFDPVKHVCARMQGGTFSSQSDCLHALKYLCDATQGTCSQSLSGTHATADECTYYCIPPLYMPVSSNVWDYRKNIGTGTSEMDFSGRCQGIKVLTLGFVDTSNIRAGQKLRWDVSLMGTMSSTTDNSACLAGVIVDTQKFKDKLNGVMIWGDNPGDGPWTRGTWGHFFGGSLSDPESHMAKFKSVIQDSAVFLVGNNQNPGCNVKIGTIGFIGNFISNETPQPGPRNYFAFLWIQVDTFNGATIAVGASSAGQNAITFV